MNVHDAVINLQDKSMVILSGDIGSGKTFTVLKLIEHNICNNDNWILLTNDKNNINYLSTLDFMSRSLQDSIGQEPNVHVFTLGDETEPDIIKFDSFFRDFVGQVIKLAAHTQVILYIDEIALSSYLQILARLTSLGSLKELNMKLILTCDLCDLLDYELRDIYQSEEAEILLLGERE